MTLLFCFAIGYLIYQFVKEKRTPTIPKGYWRNEYLIFRDRVERLLPEKEILKNAQQGKYYLTDEEFEEMNRRPNYSLREGEKNIYEASERVRREREEMKEKFRNMDRRVVKK